GLIERSILGVIVSALNRPSGLSMVWIWLSIVVIVPYLLATADISLHSWVTAEVILQEGQSKILNNAIQIDPKCGNTGSDFGNIDYFLYGVHADAHNVSTIIASFGYGVSYYDTLIPDNAGELGKLEWIVTGVFSKDPSTTYDDEFVTESNWSVKLDEPLDANTTHVSFSGSSTSVAQEAEYQLKLGIGGMIASVAVSIVDQSPGTVSIADSITVTRIGAMPLILYGIALVIIPITIAEWILLKISKYTKGIDSNGYSVIVQTVLAEMIIITDRIVYDAIRTPSWNAYFKSIEFQRRLLSQDQAGIGYKDGHFGLINGIVSSAKYVVNSEET
ncbi:2859_t:CDS:2, partial [Dentiscutata erythropus]